MPREDFLSWPFFEDRHRSLREELRLLLPTALGEIDDSDDRKACVHIVERLARGGFLEHAVPKPGANLDVRSICLIRETLSHHHGLADFAFAMQGLGSAPVTLSGSEELKERYLPPTRDGRFIAAFALSEPDAGSDVGAIATAAERDGDDYVLNGTKTWISNGGIASYYVVFARSEEAPGTKGLSAFIVDRDTPGFTVAEPIEVLAPHPLARLSFDGCRVPRSRMVGEPGQGFEIAISTLDVFRSTVGAAALGFARRALDETVKRVEARQQFGRKLADFQLTQAKLAEMATSIDASALLVYRAAWLKDQGRERVTKESSMAKMYATEAAQRVVDEAVQLFGAQGLVKGSVPERLYREVRALRIYEGTTEIQKLILAREIRKEHGF
ncbi:MAG: acyl-CoA dehydrogenase family protein [Vicinamibacteria bacterium]